VISGFTSAAAISIASTQLKGLLGLSYTANGFLDEISGTIKHISDTQWKDALVAFISLISLYVLMVGNFQSVVI
jgi:sodium-independent sulfate anion transporter 11